MRWNANERKQECKRASCVKYDVNRRRVKCPVRRTVRTAYALKVWKFRNFQNKVDEAGISYPTVYNARRQPIIPDSVPFPCNVDSGRYNFTFYSLNIRRVIFESAAGISYLTKLWENFHGRQLSKLSRKSPLKMKRRIKFNRNVQKSLQIVVNTGQRSSSETRRYRRDRWSRWFLDRWKRCTGRIRCGNFHRGTRSQLVCRRSGQLETVFHASQYFEGIVVLARDILILHLLSCCAFNWKRVTYTTVRVP